MRRGLVLVVIALSLSCYLTNSLPAGNELAAQRGEKALLGRAFLAPAWTSQAYLKAYKSWDSPPPQQADQYDLALRERYGLHPAPFSNGRLPMGLRESQALLTKGITTDCLLCHGGSILGKSYVGLGNSTLDLQALFSELAVADGRPPTTPFRFSNVRGTTEAGATGVYLLGLREPDLRMRTSRLDLDLHDEICDDAPAWWLLKKKRTMYHTGSSDARAVRPLMLFMMSPLTLPGTFVKEEATFRDIQAYLLSLEPPRYPFAIDESLAASGKKLFQETCSRCHGSYGTNWTYPNRIVPIEEIGTDPSRFYGVSKRFESYYNQTWFAHEKLGWLADDHKALARTGYQAPPLDGIWATAPYLHNGSAPTVYQVLNSKARPSVFTRSYQTDREAYDPVRLGWKVQVIDPGYKPPENPYDRRKIYDTRLPGRGNSGHTFGDDFTEEERMAVIEYLKTL